MNNPYYFKKRYDLKETKESFLFRLNKTTVKGALNYYKHQNFYNFFGIISKDYFEIQSIPSTSRRYFFNPIIIGKFIEENGKTELSIKMKLTPFDYIFITIFFIICILFGVIIYIHSLENKALVPFIFILPSIIFIIINIFFIFMAKINFNDAIYNIERIIKKDEKI